SARDRPIGEGLLRPPRFLHDIVAHEIEQPPDLDARLLQVLDQGRSKRAVPGITLPVRRDLAVLGRIDDQTAAIRLDLCKPPSGGAGSVAERPCHGLDERVVTAGIEDDKSQLLCSVDGNYDMIERNGFELHVPIRLELGIDWNKVVDAGDLDAMAGIVDDGPISLGGFARERTERLRQRVTVEIEFKAEALEVNAPERV